LKLLKTICIYCCLIAAWFLAWLIKGDGFWWLALLNRAVPYLFVPVPLFFLLLIRSGRRRFIIPLLIPIVIFVWLYRPYLFPGFANVDDHAMDLTAMTYNVLYSNLKYDDVAKVILTYHPDLVALQEVQPEMMKALVERLADNYPFSMIGTPNNFGTTAVFSRYPFSAAYVLDLHADRPAVIVKTRVHDDEITFVSAHLMAYGLRWVGLRNIPKAVMEMTTAQNEQVRILLTELENGNGLVLLGCDCNSKETSSSYRILDQVLNSAAHDVGWLWNGSEVAGLKADKDLQHIDYVWYRGAVDPLRVYKIKDSGGSDHLPVFAVFHTQ
jgi:endonuclease/exonuclease/phosphatase (EEP) superfamily protein YafD